MTPERWQRIEELFHAARELAANERAAYLQRACGADEDLRQEVESLLAEEPKAAEFIETPALQLAARALAQDTAAPAVSAAAPAAAPTAGRSDPAVVSHAGATWSTLPPRVGLWFRLVVAAYAVIAIITAVDCITWAVSPWLGLTLGDHGRLSIRGAAEAPVPLRELLATQSLHAEAVQREGAWTELQEAADFPPYQVWARPRAAYHRLRHALAGAAAGEPVVLRVRDAKGADHQVALTVGRVPVATALERILLYPGLGLLLLTFGGIVLYARPNSGQALAFAVLAAVFGGQLLTTQVLGGYPSRFYWLSLVGCYATPAAASTLALALYPKPWDQRHRWLLAVPWVAAFGCFLGATLQGTMLWDANPFVIGLRLGSWSFFAAYLVWARTRTASRQEARRLEYYLVGMAITFALPTWVYSHPGSAGAPPSPWVMLPLGLFPVVIGYGILKHRLFDVEVVLRRGLGYTVLGLVAAGLYGGLVAAATTIAGRGHFVTAGLVTVAVVLGGSLRARLQRLVDRRLNPERFGHLEAIRVAGAGFGQLDARIDGGQRAADLLAQIALDPGGLSSAAVFVARDGDLRLAAVGGGCTARPGTILASREPLVHLTTLLGSEIHRDDFASNPRLVAVRNACLSWFEQLAVELFLPILGRRGQAVGLLGVGRRRDGSPFNDEDLDILRVLVAQAARAIERSQAVAEAPADPSAGAPIAVEPGASIGHYTLVEEIGRGGMGAVFAARDERLSRVVALKFLHEHRSSQPAMSDRLRREARALAALEHPNIIHIHALEEAGGHTFVAMEYLDGENLRAELQRRGRLPAVEAVDVATILAAALEYAYQRDIIHRDVKLDNVIRSQGAIKLVDFGLAKPHTGDDTPITISGCVVGTPNYLAPELMTGAEASHRSDLYALGVVLLELLGGGEAWRRLGSGRMRAAAVADALAGLDHVPAPLVTIIERTLRPDPEERPASYPVLIADLARVRAAWI